MLTFNRKGAISENQHWTLSKCNVCLSTGVCPNLQCLNHNDLLKDKKAPTNDSPGSARQIDTGVTPQHNPFRLTPDRGGGLSEGYIPTEPRDTYMGHPPPVNYRPLKMFVFYVRIMWEIVKMPADVCKYELVYDKFFSKIVIFWGSLIEIQM